MSKNTSPLTYAEFTKAYENAFVSMMSYEIGTVGSKLFCDTMADLAEEYPNFLEKFENEVEAEAYD